MKKILLFKLKYCGYCREALQYLEQILQENPEYKDLEIEQVDEREQSARANAYDYYYVPTFYVDEEKVHEGPVNFKQVKEILRRAYDA